MKEGHDGADDRPAQVCLPRLCPPLVPPRRLLIIIRVNLSACQPLSTETKEEKREEGSVEADDRWIESIETLAPPCVRL